MAKKRVGIRNGALFNQTSTLWNNLLAYWTGDNTPNDILGNYNGTLVNGTTYGTGKINQGFSFDGVNDYVDFGNNLDFDGSTPFSISTWAKFDVLGNIEFLINKRDTTLSVRGYSLQKRNTNEIEFQLVNHAQGGQYRLAVYTSTQLTNNTFYHCVVTYDGSKNPNGVKIYLDGVSDTLVTRTNTLGNQTISNSGSLWFGNLAYQGLPLNGLLDEVGIWNRELSASEVTELYNSGSGKQYTPPAVSTPSIITDGLVLNLDAGNTSSYPGTGTDWFDLTSNNNDGVLTNGASYSTDGGGSILFDGVNDFINLGITDSLNLPNNITVSVWHKLGTPSGLDVLYGNGSSTGGRGIISFNGSTNKYTWYQNGSDYGNKSTLSTYTTGVWRNITVTREFNGTVWLISFYINGVLESSSISTSSLGLNASSAVGKFGGFNGHYFNGNISIVNLYHNVLTESQIQQNYNATKGRFGL